MKKLFLILGLTFIIIANVKAGPTFLSSLDTSLTAGYTIYDRHRAKDIYDSVNGGYYFLEDNEFSGYYIGTIAGNDDPDDILNLARLFLGDDTFGISEYEMAELTDDGTIVYDNPDMDLQITLDVYKEDDQTEAIAGSWELTNPASDQKVSFYSVKGSTEYALYYVNPAAATGKWVTDHLLNGGGNIPGLSHFTGAIGTSDEPPDVVPEPATMVLLGFGLIGLAGIGRRNRKI